MDADGLGQPSLTGAEAGLDERLVVPTACLRLSPPDFELALLDPQLGREVGLIATDLSLSLTSAPRPVMVLPRR